MLAARIADCPAISGGLQPLSYRVLCAPAQSFTARMRQDGVAAGMPIATMPLQRHRRRVASYGIRLSGVAETPMTDGAHRRCGRRVVRITGATRVLTRHRRTARSRSSYEYMNYLLVVQVFVRTSRWDFSDAADTALAQACGSILFTSETTAGPKTSSKAMHATGPASGC